MFKKFIKKWWWVVLLVVLLILIVTYLNKTPLYSPVKGQTFKCVDGNKCPIGAQIKDKSYCNFCTADQVCCDFFSSRATYSS